MDVGTRPKPRGHLRRGVRNALARQALLEQLCVCVCMATARRSAERRTRRPKRRQVRITGQGRRATSTEEPKQVEGGNPQRARPQRPPPSETGAARRGRMAASHCGPENDSAAEGRRRQDGAAADGGGWPSAEDAQTSPRRAEASRGTPQAAARWGGYWCNHAPRRPPGEASR